MLRWAILHGEGSGQEAGRSSLETSPNVEVSQKEEMASESLPEPDLEVGYERSPDPGPTPAASPEPSTSEMLAEFLNRYGSSDSETEEEELANIFHYKWK